MVMDEQRFCWGWNGSGRDSAAAVCVRPEKP